jgi:hypothetical protein
VKGFKHSLVAWLIAGSGVLYIASCEQKRTEGILSHKEMVQVLTEIYIAEDKINRLSLEPDSSRQIFAQMKSKIETKTGIPDSVLKRSLDYYMEHPVEMERIYTALVDSLNLKEQRTSGAAQ